LYVEIFITWESFEHRATLFLAALINYSRSFDVFLPLNQSTSVKGSKLSFMHQATIEKSVNFTKPFNP